MKESFPSTTRLRFCRSKNPVNLVNFCDLLGVRIEIKGSPVFVGKKWYLWFIPGDSGDDISSVDLDTGENF